MNLIVGARTSPLSKAQIIEVLKELQVFEPSVKFTPLCMETTGDKDQTTSLRHLGKSDFFTKEVDQLLLNRQCRIAIHSAKDLPEPLAQGLSLIALTKGVDPSDSLVMREGMTLNSLPKNGSIATSSLRREELVKKLRSDFSFVDIRGTIEKRIETLSRGEVDGVVIAEAALIRLGLTHLNRVKLPGETVEYQGQLAIVACEEDLEMTELFRPLDCR